jgi:single-strand DNA-binding protein
MSRFSDDMAWIFSDMTFSKNTTAPPGTGWKPPSARLWRYTHPRLLPNRCATVSGSTNKVILVGRLGNDPKLTYMQSGQPVAEMSVATDESYKDRDGNKVDRVEWHRVKVFGKSAEFCGNYLGKGRLVYVEGKLVTRKWQAQDGSDRYSTEINVANIQALDRMPDRDGQQQDAPPRKASGGRGRQAQDEGDGPAFPSEASGMDSVPF